MSSFSLPKEADEQQIGWPEVRFSVTLYNILHANMVGLAGDYDGNKVFVIWQPRSCRVIPKCR